VGATEEAAQIVINGGSSRVSGDPEPGSDLEARRAEGKTRRATDHAKVIVFIAMTTIIKLPNCHSITWPWVAAEWPAR
jgi:hypothetical protein